jgi:hypothetical protein
MALESTSAPVIPATGGTLDGISDLSSAVPPRRSRKGRALSTGVVALGAVTAGAVGEGWGCWGTDGAAVVGEDSGVAFGLASPGEGMVGGFTAEDVFVVRRGSTGEGGAGVGATEKVLDSGGAGCGATLGAEGALDVGRMRCQPGRIRFGSVSDRPSAWDRP